MVDQRTWPARDVPDALRRYIADGWWADDTVGGMVDGSLLAAPWATANILSESRPWHGTYADLRTDALRVVVTLGP